MPQIAAVLLQLHIRRRQEAGERGLLLVLGCADWQRSLLTQELQRLDTSLSSATPGVRRLQIVFCILILSEAA